MHVIFNNGGDEVLTALYTKHISDKEPLTSQSCLDFLFVIKDMAHTKDGFTSTQKIMVSVQSDYRLGKGPKVDPLLYSHAPQKNEPKVTSVQMLEALATEHKLAKIEKEPLKIFSYLLPLCSEADVLFAIKFIYVFVMLGSGELNEELIPHPAN